MKTSVQTGMPVLILLGLWGIRVAYLRNILRNKLRSEASEPVPLPIVISIKMEVSTDRQRLARWLAYYLFGLMGALVGYVVVFYYNIGLLSFAGAVGGLLFGIWLVRNTQDFTTADENILARTSGKEIIIEQGLLKLTRAFPFTGSLLSTDEPFYLVIPLNSDLHVYLSVISAYGGNRFSYLVKHSGRKVWISSSYFLSPEKSFIAALKQNGVVVKPLPFY